jgi:hypothetical protein
MTMCNNSKFMIWGKNKNINYHNQLGIFGCQLRITTCDGIVCLFLEAKGRLGCSNCGGAFAMCIGHNLQGGCTKDGRVLGCWGIYIKYKMNDVYKIYT